MMEIQRLGWTLLHFLWQGTAIAVLYAVLRALAGRSLTAQGRYLLACLALTAMTIAPLVTWIVLPRGLESAPVVASVIPWNVPASVWQRILPGFVAAWMAGVIVFSIRLLGGWRLIARLRRASHPAPVEWQRTMEQIAERVKTSRPVRLLVSSLVEVPTVIGWLRPVILVPIGTLTGLPPEHVAALLAHELAHIRRHDYVASILQSIAEAMLFYHPAVWWVSGQIRAERELCCDDLAVAASGDVLTYALALAQLESIQPTRLKPALAANGGSLVNRIRRLMEPTESPTENLPGPGAAWAMTVLWMAGVGVATVHAAQTPMRPTRIETADHAPAATRNIQGLASEARNTLLFDPFLPAQAAAARSQAPRREWRGEGFVGAAGREKKVIAPPTSDEHAFPVLAYANPLPKIAMKELEALPVATAAAAAAGTTDQVIRATTHLVQVEVIVRDKKGPVEGLNQSDFRVFDNGVEQTIGAFGAAGITRTAAQPTTIVLIDHVGNPLTAGEIARQQVAQISKLMPRNEAVAVYTLDNGFHRVTDVAGPERPGRASNGTAEISNALSAQDLPAKLVALDAIASRLADVPGRKDLIWISDGFPVVTDVDNYRLYDHMIRTVRALNKANIAVFPIGAGGVVTPGTYLASAVRGGLLPINPLLTEKAGFDPAFWAERTGGALAFNTDVALAVQRAFEDAGATYNLGFYPQLMDGKYHELKVTVDRRNVDVLNRRGYVAASMGAPDGAPDPRLAKTPQAGTLDTSMQLPFFYTGSGRARVHVSVDVIPSGMTFRQDKNGFHGQVEIVGIAMDAGGHPAAQFTDIVNINLKDLRQADLFTRTPWHYEHPLTVAVGNYVFGIEIGAGPNAVGRAAMPLNIEPGSLASFGIGGVAFSREARPVEPSSPSTAKQLVAAGKEFIPAATSNFSKSDRVYFYTEVYEPGLALAGPPDLRMEYRVLDRRTGELKQDTGMVGVAGYIRPGDPVVPFATTLPVARLKSGSYRLEVRAGHSSGPDIVARTIDFEVN